MTYHPTQTLAPVRHVTVFPAEAFRVVQGVNEGDPIADASDLVLEDLYQLAAGSQPARLALTLGGEDGAFRIAPTSPAGLSDAPVYLDCLVTFMATDGTIVEALVFVELEPAGGTIAQVWLHPLAPLRNKTGYALVTVDRDKAALRLAAEAAVAFTRGTRITMADGRQVKIEELQPGDRVLTRDSGPQSVRWIGMQTLRATGAFAPITIAAGALHNTGDLVVSPNHRLFIYQRIDALGAGRKEILVKAALLVNGTSVTQTPGGFVDYFQILFDKHEIIYAEGIAAESVFVDTAQRPDLPDEVARRLEAESDRLQRNARELGETDLARRDDAAAMLKRISAI